MYNSMESAKISKLFELLFNKYRKNRETIYFKTDKSFLTLWNRLLLTWILPSKEERKEEEIFSP